MTDPARRPHLRVSVTEIRRHPGSRLPVHGAVIAEGLTLPDVGVGVEDGAEVVFDGELESISEGVVLTGTATVPWSGDCRRCLTDVGGTATVDIREIYEVHPTDGETWPLIKEEVDLGPMLRDAALLALPLAPLCGDDCLGPAPDSFPAMVEADEVNDAPDADEPPRDPRWAALDGLDL
ncbi:MAG: YceD family protein [Aquihabitans sp.]